MTRTILASVAIIAALVLPTTATASDRTLVGLAIKHVNATQGVHDCTGRTGCAKAITRSIAAMTAITRRATKRMVATGRAECVKASKPYMAAGRASMRAATRYITANGTTATRDAYYYAAAKVDRTLIALVRGC